MEKKMENEMETELYRGLQGFGFPKIRGAFLVVPIIRIIIFWGLDWGPLTLGNYQMDLSEVIVGLLF